MLIEAALHFVKFCFVSKKLKRRKRIGGKRKPGEKWESERLSEAESDLRVGLTGADDLLGELQPDSGTHI